VISREQRRAGPVKEILEQVLAVLNTSFHRNLGMGRNPYSVLTGKEPDRELSAKLKAEAESRRNSKLYIKGAIPEGTAVKVNMRVDGPSSVKDAIKPAQRKGYLPSYVDQVWRVRLRRGNLYWLVDKQGNRREGAVDRADLLPLPSDDPKNVWKKAETVVVRDESPPKVRIRVKAAPKTAKLAYSGPHKELISKVFKEKNITYKVVAIWKEKDEDGKLIDVGYYKRLLKSGKLQGKRYYETIDEIKGYPSVD
jgi:hypothetical protein